MSSEIPPFVFLGGTWNGSTWRQQLIPQLKCEYFDPIVEEWNDEARRLEEYAKKAASIHLYIITPKFDGLYSVAELTERSITHPDTTVVGFLEDPDGTTWNEHQTKSNMAIIDLIVKYGTHLVYDLEQAARIINHKLSGSELLADLAEDVQGA